jgi:hypothetical protein
MTLKLMSSKSDKSLIVLLSISSKVATQKPRGNSVVVLGVVGLIQCAFASSSRFFWRAIRVVVGVSERVRLSVIIQGPAKGRSRVLSGGWVGGHLLLFKLRKMRIFFYVLVWRALCFCTVIPNVCCLGFCNF